MSCEVSCRESQMLCCMLQDKAPGMLLVFICKIEEISAIEIFSKYLYINNTWLWFAPGVSVIGCITPASRSSGKARQAGKQHLAT